MISLGKALSMDDVAFEDFRRSILLPMIRRHEQMFPRLHQRESIAPPHWEPSLSPLPPPMSPSMSPPSMSPSMSPTGKPSEPGRYDPCPCNSGKKYKFCCGQTPVRKPPTY